MENPPLVAPEKSAAWHWPWWPLVPIYPYGQRRTLFREVIPGEMWIFEQLQGIFYVVVPIRMTVIRLQEGGLLVYAPVAPTPECLGWMADLVARYGEVKYIIFPTVSGLEHKVFVGPFARRFPQAQVFVPPHQWSFPLSLPLSWLGFPLGRTQILPEDSRRSPFGQEFDYEILGPIGLGVGNFGEVALLHRRSQTLLVTDSLISIAPEADPVLTLDPYPLLYHGRDHHTEAIADTPELRRKGWQRIVLFALYFQPQALGTAAFWESLRQTREASDRSGRNLWGFYPFQWQDHYGQSFEALRKNGCLQVAPILQTLIFNRQPAQVVAWADRVSRWNFWRIIPCHFSAPLAAGPEQFRRAFNYFDVAHHPQEPNPFPVADLHTLTAIDRLLQRWKITPPNRLHRPPMEP